MIQINRAASLVALALLLACQLNGRLVSSGSSVLILDESNPLDVEAIARVLCEPAASREKQISRLSTVDKLVEFFEQQVSGESHEFFKCKQQHGEALRLLREVLNGSKENVCSARKLALIEDFHNQFVSKLAEHKKSRKEERREAAPQLLRLFFMHYAMEVDAVCKRSLVKNLEWGLKQKLGDDIEEKLFRPESTGQADDVAFGAVFKGAMQKFSELYSVMKYEDVLMVWDLMENSYLDEKMDVDTKRIRDQFDPVTGEPVRMLARVRTTRHLNRIKEHCHYNFKPIYSKLILPLIKLADLGYSNNGEQARFELAELKLSEQVKQWYSALQLCEALLPVMFYEDPSLGAKDFVVITKQEAAELDATNAAGKSDARPMAQLVYEPDTNSMESVDRLDSVATVEPRRLLRSVKGNWKARASAIGRAVLRLLRKLKGSFKKGFGRIFLSKPSDKSRNKRPKPDGKANKFVAEEVGQQMGKTLESMNERELEYNPPPRMIKPRRDRKSDVPRTREHDVKEISWSDIAADCGGVLGAITDKFKTWLKSKQSRYALIAICLIVGVALGMIIITVLGR